ncbi:MAG: hypothetical protein V1676_04265 [Candidatus Diapherotrites archaeon]
MRIWQTALFLLVLLPPSANAAFAGLCEWKHCADAPLTASYDSLWDEGEPANSAGIPLYWGKMLETKRMHPQLKVTATFVPKSEAFSSETSKTSILAAPEEVKKWVLDVQGSGWIELADHGLTHMNGLRRAGEFDAYEQPLALDPAWCGGTVSEIRATFAAAGLDNSLITGFRGPAYMWTDCIADALAENGFRYILVKRNYGNFLRPRMMKVAEGKFYTDTFDPYPLYYDTASGSRMVLVPTTIYLSSYEDKQYLEYLIKSHAVLNFFFHSEDLLDSKNFSDWDKTLAYLEKSNLWWATAGEVADYWEARQNTTVSESLNGSELRIHIETKKAAEGTQLSLLLRTKTPVESAVFRGERIVPEAGSEGVVLTHDFGSGGELVVEFESAPQPFDSGARAADAARASELLGAMHAEKTAAQNINLLEFALIEAGLVVSSALFLAFGRRGDKMRNWRVLLVSFAIIQPVLIALSIAFLGILQPSVFAIGVPPFEEALICLMHLGFSPTVPDFGILQIACLAGLFAWFAMQCAVVSIALRRLDMHAG